MRLLKCYPANDREGHFVTAGEAMSVPGLIGVVPPADVVWCRMPALSATRRGLNTIRGPWLGMC